MQGNKTIYLNEKDLKRFITWNPSRNNKMTKMEVVKDILKRATEKLNGKFTYHTSDYQGGQNGFSYTLEIKDGAFTLSDDVKPEVYPLKLVNEKEILKNFQSLDFYDENYKIIDRTASECFIYNPNHETEKFGVLILDDFERYINTSENKPFGVFANELTDTLVSETTLNLEVILDTVNKIDEKVVTNYEDYREKEYISQRNSDRAELQEEYSKSTVSDSLSNLDFRLITLEHRNVVYNEFCNTKKYIENAEQENASVAERILKERFQTTNKAVFIDRLQKGEYDSLNIENGMQNSEHEHQQDEEFER